MTERLRVLYAEDNLQDADLTKAHFEAEAPNIELEVVDSGKKCLARLEARQHDVVLVDHHLPDMDGITLLKELAEKEVSLPAVIVTGVGDEALVVQALRLGAVNYVPKDGEYLKKLPAVLESAAVERKLGRGGFTPSRRRILYVEHNSLDIDLTLRHLEEAAPYFTVEVARSAGQALSFVLENRYDLVLADLRIPDMNAIDLLRELKQRGLSVPFVVITGKGDEAAAVAALKMGAYDYIVKRDNYLTQLTYAIDNAIARSQLAESNQRLRTELEQKRQAEADNARLLAEVQSQRQHMDDIIASAHGFVWESWGPPDDPIQKTEFISSYVEPMLGYSIRQWLSTPNFWLIILHPEDRDRVISETAKFFKSGKGGISQFRWIAEDGRIVWVETHCTVIFDGKGNPVGMRGVSVDITASKESEQARGRLEEQLLQAQKMESIGRLAGGVAHDFNNFLTTINGYTELILQGLDAENPFRASLTEIRKAGERAAELTRQLLAFSRRQVLQPRTLSLNMLIRDSYNMLKLLLGENIELVTSLDPELGFIKGDASQVHQVILNIAINARDAMPEGGTLILETRNITIDEDDDLLKRGAYVMLSISDTGIGMDAQTVNRIFEPFFTTKEAGKGTGLGLSMVYGIVKQSGGSISVHSEPGHGTIFRISLPRIDRPAAEMEEKRAETEIPRGAETILVVEDDEMVRKLTCQVLRSCGYQVFEAASGNEALLASGKHRGPIHLMITDVGMPQMGGRELADRFSQLRPEMRVLYMSGYTADAALRHGFLDPGMLFLSKPFSPKALTQKVRGILDQGAEH